jgi:hypothetical protein
MYVPELTKNQAIILLLVFIAIGGLVLYGSHDAPQLNSTGIVAPKMEGPSTPPPGYAAVR